MIKDLQWTHSQKDIQREREGEMECLFERYVHLGITYEVLIVGNVVTIIRNYLDAKYGNGDSGLIIMTIRERVASLIPIS